MRWLVLAVSTGARGKIAAWLEAPLKQLLATNPMAFILRCRLRLKSVKHSSEVKMSHILHVVLRGCEFQVPGSLEL